MNLAIKFYHAVVANQPSLEKEFDLYEISLDDFHSTYNLK